MKKYLFLFALFIIYLFLVNQNEVTPSISYEDKYDNNVSDVTIKFETGINSNDLIKLFEDYNSEYYVYNIKTKNDNVDLSCNSINYCVKNIYDTQDKTFEILYSATGFSIKEISIISYTQDIFNFINEYNLLYVIN